MEIGLMFLMIERPPTSATERKMKIATPPRTHTATTHGHGQVGGQGYHPSVAPGVMLAVRTVKCARKRELSVASAVSQLSRA
jgi:hypothetical protein